MDRSALLQTYIKRMHIHVISQNQTKSNRVYALLAGSVFCEIDKQVILFLRIYFGG